MSEAERVPESAIRKELEMVSRILDGLTEAIVIAGQKEGSLFFNSAAERLFGIPRNKLRPNDWLTLGGCYLTDEITPYPAERSPILRSLKGETIVGEQMFVKNPQHPAGKWLKITGKPLKNQGGQVRGAVIEFRDITQHRDVDETARRLSSALEQTADSVFITNKSGVIEYVNPAFESTTGYSKEESLGKTPALLKSGRYDASFYRELWATVQGGEVFRATIANRKNGGEIYWAQQTITPMKNADGTITHFVSVLKDVTAEKKQQELEYQMRLASEVQRNLYRDLVAMPAGFDIVGSVHPANAIGGDFFDLIPMPGGCLGIAIGDVVGHGLNSALLMAETRACLRSIATADSNVGRVLAALNEVVTPDFGAGFFATVLFAKIDPRERTLSYSNAGHVPGYLFDTRGRIKHVLSSTGTPIGLFKDFECPSGGCVKLDPGSLLVFMTDGITEAEAQNGSMMGSKPVLKFIRRNRQKSVAYLSRGLFRLAKNFAGSRPQRDDIASVLCKVG